jgi:hypothetical protein
VTTETVPAAFFAARPSIRIDGQLQDALGDLALQSLLIEETTLGLFRCEASFLNWGPKGGSDVGFLFFDRSVLDFGKTISVEFGPPSSSGPVFAGRISGIEGQYPPARPPELLVLAEDRFQDLRMERRTRSFEDVTDADVIGRIASEHSLTPQLDIAGPTYPVLTQVNQSDLAFIRQRAAAVDAELWIDNKTLYAQSRSRRSSGSMSFTYGQGLLEFTVLADLAHQRTSVTVNGWSVADKDVIEAEADAAAISAEAPSGRGGSAVLAQALAPRKDRIVAATPVSRDEAKSIAEARYRERARGFLRGTGVVDGNKKLRVGSTVEMSGLGPFFDGKYYVSLARHTFTLRDGYRTAFQVERPFIGG